MSSPLNRSAFGTLRKDIFFRDWPLDHEITAISSAEPSHRFLQNPAGQYAYIYLTQYVRAVSERHFGFPFGEVDILDWGCGKGHVSKLLRNLSPGKLRSCDVQAEKADSAFGQSAPILERFQITVDPLHHPSAIPYPDDSFHVVVSFGVLEHVPDDAASIVEITRILKLGGLFFCFFLPTRLSWTQAISRMGGNNYHDRLYTPASIETLLTPVKLELCDLWYRSLLPKNSINYPAFRLFERADQWMTNHTPLRYLATNIEFVACKTK
jgi:SAM-dependent methyltransferase